MKIILNARSKQQGTEVLASVISIVPNVKAFMFPLTDSNCISLEFNDNAEYTQPQRELIMALQTLERLSL